MTVFFAVSSANRRRLGWLGVLAGSVLLHLLALSWASGRLRVPEKHAAAPEVIAANIIVPPETRPPPPVPPEPKPAPKVRRKPRPAPPPPPPPEVAVADHALTESITAPADTPAVAEAEPPAAPEPAAPEPAVAEAPPPEEPAAPRYRIDLPPSALLKYDVQKTPRDGAPTYGRGSIEWQTDGSRYAVIGDAGILFFTVLNFRSEGTIEDIGIAPQQYREKRFRRAETSTVFHRDANTISFSASNASYPRTSGEQDRASVIWQLAGIGRGDREKFIPGAQIELFVAGTRDAATWKIRVLGEEEINIGGETVLAWHVQRIPPAGKPDQTLDIWLAPHQQWYPVRLRYTEANGDYLDMSLSNLNLSQNP